MKMERPGNYTLYDITVSPLTSGISRNQPFETNNPNRVINAIETNNYARFSFTGPPGNRKLNVEFIGVKGEKLGQWSVDEKALNY
jgi:alkaline phosphatase D